MSYELCISVIHYVMQHSVINSPIHSIICYELCIFCVMQHSIINSPIHSIIFYELCISVIISCSNVEGKGYIEL